MGILFVLMILLGLFCLLYYGVIIFYAGFTASFSWFWLLAGFGCLIIALCLRYIDLHDVYIPKAIKVFVIIFAFLGGSFGVLLEGTLLYHANQTANNGADYLIVLGAQVKGTVVSKSLQRRLDTAKEYLLINPETIVIVTGGQGKGEDISEAEAMKRYLTGKGIAAGRIVMEDRSVNTNQNILNSKKIINNNKAKIVIVTNGFHIYRAVELAKKKGFTNIEGLSAPTDFILFINYYIREAAAVIKDKIVGNI